MIKIFTGDDRVRAKQEITKLLGTGYEVLDGADISPDDLPSIFLGASLLTDHRHILIRDFTANKATYEKLPDYLSTPHDVILFETKLDKRSAAYKAVKDRLEIKEFTLPKPNFNLVFDIYRTAKHDGIRAVEMLAQIQNDEDPIMFTGLLISQALKDFSARPTGTRERRILQELAKTDLQQKTTGTDPWLLVKSFLLRLSTLT